MGELKKMCLALGLRVLAPRLCVALAGDDADSVHEPRRADHLRRPVHRGKRERVHHPAGRLDARRLFQRRVPEGEGMSDACCYTRHCRPSLLHVSTHPLGREVSHASSHIVYSDSFFRFSPSFFSLIFFSFAHGTLID